MSEVGKKEQDREYTGGEIAIIGMSGRFPGAGDIRAYWENLKNGTAAIRHPSEAELLSRGADPFLLRKASYVKAVSMLDRMEFFDASFFGYTPREAAIMDPQQRIFLECAWEALESAGYTSEKTGELISVFASTATNTYLIYNLLSNQTLLAQTDPVQIDVSNANDHMATRVSYKLNLTGPSFTVQSACSSSLVAVHQACQNLLNQESDIAIAGGIAIDVRQQLGYQYADGSIVSPDGYCRAFDAEANGTIFGSGGGVVVLRRLEDALAKGDTIYAIIKGSATNNDGADKVGYTAPAVDGQAAVIAEALSVSGCGPETISYVETHGTGTKMGDPVEMRALSKAFHTPNVRRNYCAIGSVKSQIGHLSGAAGISSLIKTILALHHRQIPPSLNFSKPNPEIDFTNSPFFVNTELTEWNHPLRRAGVSSFGVGGTNVHMVLEEAPQLKATTKGRKNHLLILSAKTESALTRAKNNLGEFLARAEQNGGLNLADVAFTLQLGRKDFNYRSFAVCDDINAAATMLSLCDPQRMVTSLTEVENRPVVFVFPGQDIPEDLPPCGLYEHEPLFRQKFDMCLDVLNKVLTKAGYANRLTWQLLHDSKQSLVFKQIAHFMTEYSIAASLQALCIVPEAMIGEDTGEYTAACLAGVMSVEQVCLLYLSQDGLPKLNNAQPNPVYDFRNAFRQSQRNAPKIPFISALTGQWISDSEAQSADYWLEDRKNAVRFSGGWQRIMEDESAKILLQIGRSSPALDKVKDSLKSVKSCRTNQDYRGNGQDAASFQEALGQLWLSGVKIDWQGLYQNETRRRVPLPTYPLSGERYWIDYAPPGNREEAQPVAAKEQNSDNWFYFPGFKNSSPPEQASLFEKEANWLILGDSSPLAAGLANYLKANRQRVIEVHAAERFEALGEDSYRIHPGRKQDYETLFATLKNTGKVPEKILHLWSLSDPNVSGTAASDPDRFDACQEKGFWSVIYTALALEKPAVAGFRYQLWTITNHLFAIESKDTIAPEKATLLAPTQVIPIEYPYIDCYCLEVDPGMMAPSAPDGSVPILKEIQTAGAAKIIAYRGRQRWLQNYEPIQLKQPMKPLRREGVYLVTDDVNGIGLRLAEYLIKTYQAKVLLIENVLFPQRSAWPAGANQGDNAGDKIRKITELEATGRLQFSSVDLRDYGQVEQFIQQAVANYGVLHGVIHGADDLNHTGFDPLSGLGRVNPDDYFSLKIKSLYYLKKALAPYQLDFLMLISSLAPVLGGLGQIINAAQCAFLDHYAIREGNPWISVNWDIWRLTNSQEGIYKDAIEPEEGIGVFGKIMTAYTGNRLIVSTTGLKPRIARLSQPHPNGAETQKNSLGIKHPRPDLKTPYTGPGSEVEKKLAASWEECLGIEGIGVDDDFFELGGHSLLITQLLVQVQNLFQIEFPVQILFENTTIKNQALRIQDIMAQGRSVSTKPIIEQLKATFPTERKQLLVNYLKNKIAAASNVKVEELPLHINLDALSLEDKLLFGLMLDFKKDFKLQVFTHEMKSFTSLAAMAQFLLAELERFSNLAALATGKKLADYQLHPFSSKAKNIIQITKKNKPMVFLHSSPRAGSTLMRTMLAGHSRLFCPPELNILFFETMREWKEDIGFGHQFEWTQQGLHWAIVELNKIGVDEGWRMLDEFIARNITVQDMYAKLQELCADKILVDKTPPYCLDMRTLQYAEEIITKPKYIFLCRHPYAVMESMLKLRLDKLFSRSLYMNDEVDPYVVVEMVWNLSNRNLLEFADQLDKERLLWVKFEEFVKNPGGAMKDICAFLEIPYEESVLTPYDGKKERMMGGMGGLGDPNILLHNSIDPKLADVWKEIRMPYPLDESTKAIASELGYELPDNEGEDPFDESILSSLNLTEEEVMNTLSEFLSQDMDKKD